MKTDLFDYHLPEDLIASRPPEARDGGRLMVVDVTRGEFRHARITDLPDLLPPRSLLVGNDTKVIPARLIARRPTGGSVEILFVRLLDRSATSCRYTALTRANKAIREGDSFVLDAETVAVVVEKRDRGETVLDLNIDPERLGDLLSREGQVPLPPYIRRPADASDKERYQTVWAQHDGSVAAPTAGLHFTPKLVQDVRDRGHQVAFVTLHVGPGTFRPILAEDLSSHAMDQEHFTISATTAASVETARTMGEPVIAVGTTVVRALEGAHTQFGSDLAGEGFTEIFITPPFSFGVVDGLLTNFHLPKSTLICLVSALAGRELVMAAYEAAVADKYRFYSYGDAMLILPRKK